MVVTETGYQAMISNEIRKRMKWLIIKSMFKMLIISIVLVNFLYVYPMISLIILFVAYFTMPTSYSTDEPYKAIEAWMRMFLGLAIASLLWSILTFGGTAAGFINGLLVFPALVQGGMAFPIYLLCLAFFFTLPKKEKAAGIGIGGLWSGRKYEGTKRGAFAGYMRNTVSGDDFSSVGNMVFVVFVLMAGIFILRNWLQAGLESSMTFIFIIFWILSLVAGWFGGREGRPYIGIMMVGMAILIFSFQFTGIVGGAMFGAYWPTIEHYGSMITEPMGGAFESASEGVSNAWLLMTCPSCYEAQQREEQQAKASKIKTGGTAKSIELTDFNAINYGTGTPTIDPNIPLIGSIKLENKGEFTATNIRVKLNPPLIKDPSRVGLAFNSDEDCYKEAIAETDANVRDEALEFCTFLELTGDSCIFTACTGADQEDFSANDIDECTWNTESNPGDIKLMTFQCGEAPDFEAWDYDGEEPMFAAIKRCDCWCRQDVADCREDTDGKYNAAEDDEYTKGPCEGVCDLSKAYLVYTYADFYTTIDMDYEFDYSVDGQAEVNIMDKDIFLEKLINDEIRPESKESKYTGGPVIFTIWIQDQPLRSGEKSFATISILNNGKGTINNNDIDLIEVKIPKEHITELEVTSNIGFLEPVIDDESDPEFYIITTTLNRDLATKKSARFTFNFVGDLPVDEEGVSLVIEKTTLFTAEFDYTYSTNKKLEFPIVSVPLG